MISSIFLVTFLTVSSLLGFLSSSTLKPRFGEPYPYPFTTSVDFDAAKTPFPVARTDNVTFTYQSAVNGTVIVPDPFHWFEETNKSASDIQAFVDAQLAFKQEYVAKVKDADLLEDSVKKADFYKAISLPQSFGPKDSLIYVYYVSEAYMTQYDCIYYITNQSELDEAIKNNFTTYPGKQILDTTHVGVNHSANHLRISPDGQKLLYETADVNAWGNTKINVRDVSSPLTNETGKTDNEGVTDQIFGARTAEWLEDSKSFIYSIFDDQDASTLRVHTLGTDVKDDLILTKPLNSPDCYSFTVSDDRKSLIAYIVHTSNDTDDVPAPVYIAPIDEPITATLKWVNVPMVPNQDYEYATNVGADYYFGVGSETSGGHIAHFNIDLTQAQPTKELATLKPLQIQEDIVVPERVNSSLIFGYTFDTDKIVGYYVEDDTPELIISDLKTGKQLQSVSPDPFAIIEPDLSIEHFPMMANPYGKTIYFWEYAFNTPYRLSRLNYDSNTNETDCQLYYETKTDYINADDFIVEKKLVSSTDGVPVPVFLMYHKDVKLDGSSPALIRSYGAYGIGVEPTYNPRNIAFAKDYKAVIVYPGIRGGNDIGGEAWHQAATLGNKHHTFEDIFAVSNYLIDQNYSKPGHLILFGEGAGAISSAVINQDLQNIFGAFIGKRGIYDMLRLDQSPSEASRRIKEFGDPQTKEGFDWLYSYSPINNVQEKKIYPFTMVVPGHPDDENEPWQTYKYLATLQNLLPNNLNPFFLGNASQSADERGGLTLAMIAHAFGLQRSE